MNREALIASTLDVAAKEMLRLANYTCVRDRPATPYNPYCTGCPFDALRKDAPFDHKQAKVMCTHPRRYPK